MRERQFVADLVSDQKLPRMFRAKQKFLRNSIEVEKIPNIIEHLLSDEKFSSQIKPGMRIAITAGSRGIANVALTTKCIADFVKKKGAKPFIVPAMGSHGGATARKDRVEILEGIRHYRSVYRMSDCFFYGGQENRIDRGRQRSIYR